MGNIGSMRFDCSSLTRAFIIGSIFAVPFIFVEWANAQGQNQDMTPSMVINMSDLSIRVGNVTSNETITFSNNSADQSGNSTP